MNLVTAVSFWDCVDCVCSGGAQVKVTEATGGFPPRIMQAMMSPCFKGGVVFEAMVMIGVACGGSGGEQNKVGDLYSAYPALPGGSRRWEQSNTECRATRQKGKLWISAHILPPLAVNSKSERKVNSLPPLGCEPVIFGMLAHLSNQSAKSHPLIGKLINKMKQDYTLRGVHIFLWWPCIKHEQITSLHTLTKQNKIKACIYIRSHCTRVSVPVETSVAWLRLRTTCP
jgi:hypothetical protein